jgi:hypothetical protein
VAVRVVLAKRQMLLVLWDQILYLAQLHLLAVVVVVDIQLAHSIPAQAVVQVAVVQTIQQVVRLLHRVKVMRGALAAITLPMNLVAEVAVLALLVQVLLVITLVQVVLARPHQLLVLQKLMLEAVAVLDHLLVALEAQAVAALVRLIALV